jgi:hypothetical protein
MVGGVQDLRHLLPPAPSYGSKFSENWNGTAARSQLRACVIGWTPLTRRPHLGRLGGERRFAPAFDGEA